MELTIYETNFSKKNKLIVAHPNGDCQMIKGYFS